MAEFIANNLQTVEPNGVLVLYNTRTRCCCKNCCSCSCVEHADGTGGVILRGCKPKNCKATYNVSFSGNIAVPATGTPAREISVALSLNGETLPAATGTATPGAVGRFFNVAFEKEIEVPMNCCLTVAVRNISDQAIQIRNGNLTVNRA